jgi:hypothetical protein
MILVNIRWQTLCDILTVVNSYEKFGGSVESAFGVYNYQHARVRLVLTGRYSQILQLLGL